MAIATPPGAGAVGVVRVSGPEALAVVRELVRPWATSLDAQPPGTLRRADVVDPDADATLDHALCAVMRGPRSYTGEDVVEVSCHGSPVVLERLLTLIVRAGARIAEPGEFTKRAFLNGRLDLAEAEAVIQLISARTTRAAILAARALQGGLSRRALKIRDALLDVIAGLEVALDFPDDQVGVSGEEAAARIAPLVAEVGRLLGGMRTGQLVHGGLSVAIAGAPNVGKSSLLNALLDSERAIVSPQPGTTRDLVEGGLVLEGVPVRLVDTAGLRDALDPVEAEGVRRSRRAISESDLLLLVVDAGRENAADPLDARVTADRIVIYNKIDLVPRSSRTEMAGLLVSALTGEGVDALRGALADWVRRRLTCDGEEGGLVSTARQIELLDAAAHGLKESLDVTERAAPIEIALVSLRATLRRLDELLGVEVDDAILDRIFSTFCVGK